MRGVRLLHERNLPLKLKTVPLTINFHEVFEMKRFAEEDLGVEFKFDPLVNPRTDCSQSPLAVRLSPEQVVWLDFKDPVRKAEYRKMAETELAQARSVQGPEKYSCGGGQNGCAIDPGGRMTICVLSQQDGYDFRQGNFQDGWSGHMREIRDSQRTRQTICSRCQLQSLCSMCPANGELENGKAEAPVEFLCKVAHLRALSLGLEIPEHGDCPCCSGGKHHANLTESAERLQKISPSSENIVPLRNNNSFLPVLQ